MADLSEAKQQLEVDKLKLEMRFIKRNHYAQIFNTAALVLVGLVVFYFFQRPQIDQMENTRLATEKQQVATLVINALQIENERDRTNMLKAFTQMYPQYEFVGTLSRSDIILTEAPPKPQPASPSTTPDLPVVVKQQTSPADLNEQRRDAVRKVYEQKLAEFRKQAEYCRSLDDRQEELSRIERELRFKAGYEERGLEGLKAGRGAAWRSLMMQAEKARSERDYLMSRAKDCTELRAPESPADL